MLDDLQKEYSKLGTKDLTATFVSLCHEGNLDAVFLIMDDENLFAKIDKNYHSMAFEIACSKGNLELVKKFKSESNKFRLSNYHGCEKACVNNQIEVLDYFLLDGSVGTELDSLLSKSLKSGKAESVKRILTCEKFKKTPQLLGTNHPAYKSIFISGKLIHLNDIFIQACKDGHLDIVKLLLLDKDIPKNVDIEYREHEGLIAAYDSKNIELVKFLLTDPKLQKHADIHAQDDALFIHACRKCDLDFMEYLLTSPKLKEHADIHAQGEYALKNAIKQDRDDIAKFLITDSRLKKKIDISKSIDTLYEAHYSRTDDYEYNYDKEYEAKVMNYIITDYKFIATDLETERMLNQILVSIPELKQKYEAIKLINQLEKELDENKQKENSRKLKL